MITKKCLFFILHFIFFDERIHSEEFITKHKIPIFALFLNPCIYAAKQ